MAQVTNAQAWETAAPFQPAVLLCFRCVYIAHRSELPKTSSSLTFMANHGWPQASQQQQNSCA